MSFNTLRFNHNVPRTAPGQQYLPARPSDYINNGQVLPSLSEIYNCEWYWKSQSLQMASFRYHNQHLPEQEKQRLFHKHMELRRKVEFYRGVTKAYQPRLSTGEEWPLFSDEDIEKLEAIPGVLELAAVMGFLRISEPRMKC